MKIIMLITQNTPEGIYAEGNEYGLSEGQAKTWIACGIAKPVVTTRKRKGDDD